jgi:hypothetical protein
VCRQLVVVLLWFELLQVHVFHVLPIARYFGKTCIYKSI